MDIGRPKNLDLGCHCRVHLVEESFKIVKQIPQYSLVTSLTNDIIRGLINERLWT